MSSIIRPKQHGNIIIPKRLIKEETDRLHRELWADPDRYLKQKAKALRYIPVRAEDEHDWLRLMREVAPYIAECSRTRWLPCPHRARLRSTALRAQRVAAGAALRATQVARRPLALDEGCHIAISSLAAVSRDNTSLSEPLR